MNIHADISSKMRISRTVHGASEKARLAFDCDQVSKSLLLFWEREDPC